MGTEIPWGGDMKAFIARKIAEIDATPVHLQQRMPWACDLCHDMGYVLGELTHPLNPESEVTVADYCTCPRADQEKRGAKEYFAGRGDRTRGRRPRRVRLDAPDDPDGRIGG